MKKTNRTVLFCAASLGLSSIVTQILALREFLNIFSGNELVLGLILGNWLLLTGAGTYLGRHAGRLRAPFSRLVLLMGLVAVFPPLQLLGIRFLRRLYPAGLMLGLGEAFLASFLLLLPFCLLSGFLLAFFSGLASGSAKERRIGEVYLMDTLGSVLGGLLFSLCLVHFLSPVQVLTFLLLLNLFAAGMVAFAKKKLFAGMGTAAALVLFLAALTRFDLERFTAEQLFPGQTVLEQRSTPYGTLTLTQSGRQLNVYANSIPVGSTADVASAEEMVHYALGQNLRPQNILLISGSLKGAAAEVEKYSVERIDGVELDPAVIALARRLRPSAADSRLRWIADDARRFVRNAHDRYDAILVDLPGPSTAQLNRYYTEEFFTEAHRALRPGGVFSITLKSAENYANPQLRRLASSVFRSLGSTFPETIVVPGRKMVLLASERPLDYRISERLEEKGIRTSFVNRHYLEAMLTPDRIEAAKQAVSEPVALNRDFHPRAYYAQLQYWLSRFEVGLWLPALVLAGVCLALLLLISASENKVVSIALSGSGFAGMGLEVVILLAFQVCYGYVYELLGLLVTAFLMGAAAGGLWSLRGQDKAMGRFFRLDACLALTAFLIAPLLLWAAPLAGRWLHPAIPPAFFALLTAWVGFLVGGQFPAAGMLGSKEIEERAGLLYAVDLLGAGLGAILISAFSIPLLGITATCYLIGGLKLCGTLLLLLAPDSSAVRPRSPFPKPAFAPWMAPGLVILGFVSIGIVILDEHTSTGFYGLSIEPAYHGILLAFLAWGVLEAMGLKLFRVPAGTPSKGILGVLFKLRKKTGFGLFRWLSYMGFGVAIFYPVFRCFFKIPYLFCHVCPRKCVFGYLRPYLIPAALVMNLEKRHWCYHVCPIGTLHQAQASAAKKIRRLPRWLSALSWVVLAFLPFLYFKVKWDYESQPAAPRDWFTALFNNAFTVSWEVIAAACLILLLGFRLRRTFCGTLCPVGTLSQLLLDAPKRWSPFRSKAAPAGGLRGGLSIPEDCPVYPERAKSKPSRGEDT